MDLGHHVLSFHAASRLSSKNTLVCSKACESFYHVFCIWEVYFINGSDKGAGYITDRTYFCFIANVLSEI